MAERLTGKVAVITGTGSGQGRVAALRFAAEGARVVGCDLDADGAQATLEAVHAAGGQMMSVHPLDLGDEEAIAGLFDATEDHFGGIDILYNNAAAVRLGTMTEQSRSDFEFTLTNELTIVWLATKHAVEHFRRRGGGCVINVGSVAGLLGSGFVGNAPHMFAHSASKAAVIRLTQAMAVDLAAVGVRVNCISPGIIETEVTGHLLGAEGSKIRRHFTDQLLLPRIGRADDVINAAVFLASEEASYITGVNLPVDGGWLASGGVGTPSAQLLTDLDELFTAST